MATTSRRTRKTTDAATEAADTAIEPTGTEPTGTEPTGTGPSRPDPEPGWRSPRRALDILPKLLPRLQATYALRRRLGAPSASEKRYVA